MEEEDDDTYASDFVEDSCEVTDDDTGNNEEVNILKIHKITIWDLKNTEVMGKQDPYVIMSMGEWGYDTDVHEGAGGRSSWELDLAVPVTRTLLQSTPFNLCVKDKNNITSDKLIGYGAVEINVLDSRPNEWVDLQGELRDKENEVAGHFTVSMTYQQGESKLKESKPFLSVKKKALGNNDDNDEDTYAYDDDDFESSLSSEGRSAPTTSAHVASSSKSRKNNQMEKEHSRSRSSSSVRGSGNASSHDTSAQDQSPLEQRRDVNTKKNSKQRNRKSKQIAAAGSGGSCSSSVASSSVDRQIEELSRRLAEVSAERRSLAAAKISVPSPAKKKKNTSKSPAYTSDDAGSIGSSGGVGVVVGPRKRRGKVPPLRDSAGRVIAPLHHPRLDYVIADASVSPYLTNPGKQYSPATLHLPDVIRDIRFQSHGPEATNLPLDMQQSKEVFFRDVVNYRLEYNPPLRKKKKREIKSKIKDHTDGKGDCDGDHKHMTRRKGHEQGHVGGAVGVVE